MKPNYTIKDDRASAAYRATCKTGFRWEEDLHELVEPYSPTGGTVCRSWKNEARREIEARVAEYLEHGKPERCDAIDCDWCQSSDAIDLDDESLDHLLKDIERSLDQFLKDIERARRP